MAKEHVSKIQAKPQNNDPPKQQLPKQDPPKEQPKIEPKPETPKVVLKEEKAEAKQGGDDFKNSLAALIGRGKPTYKKEEKPKEEEKEAQKVKVDLFNEDSDDEPKQSTHKRKTVQEDALDFANNKAVVNA